MTKPTGHLRPVDGEATSSRTKKVRTSFILPQRWKDFLDEEAARQHTSMAAVILRAISDYANRNSGATSWETVDDNLYDPLAFYTASQDRHGHSFHLRVNIPKPLAGEMGSLVQSGEIPQYRTLEDIARDAIVHRVKKIAQMLEDGDLERAVDLFALRAQEQRLLDMEEEAEEVMDLIRQNVIRLRARHPAGLKAYLAEREEYAEHFPEPHRSELLALIEKEREKDQSGRRRRGR